VPPGGPQAQILEGFRRRLEAAAIEGAKELLGAMTGEKQANDKAECEQG
jgi:hypothetical protein